MKKLVSVWLVLFLVVSLFSVTGNAAQLDSYENAKKIVETAYASNSFEITAADEEMILSSFSAEMRYVENKYGVTIRELNENNVELLKHEAVLNLENERYRFSELMKEIAIACAEYKIENALSKTGGTRSDPTVDIDVVREIGALRGAHFLNVPTGSSISRIRTGTVSIAANSELYGYTIEGSVSESITYTCNGPADGATLYSGRLATHRTAFGVLYGQIVKHTVEYPNGNTYVFYYVDAVTRRVEFHTVLTALGAQAVYANTERGTTVQFANQLDFEEKIETNPEYFLQ